MSNGANKFPRWVLTIAMLAVLMSILAVWSGIQAVSLSREEAPFAFTVVDVPAEVCVGGTLEYRVALDIQDAPLTIEVVRSWKQNGRILEQMENKRPYAHPEQIEIGISIPVPAAVQPGPVELVVVGSAIYYEANGYSLSMVAKECD